MFASGPDGVLVQAPNPNSRRYTHNPYAAATEVAPVSSVVTAVERLVLRNVHAGDFLAETAPRSVASVANPPKAPDVEQDNILDRIYREIERLGSTKYSKELIRDYIDLISHCKYVSQDQSHFHLKPELQSCTAYTLLGLSNVYGKMQDNLNKFRTAMEAFLIYVDLHQMDFTFTTRENPHYKAGTCLLGMNQAVFYMFIGCGDNAQRIYDESRKLIQTYAEDDGARRDLLECFGYRADIKQILCRIRFRIFSVGITSAVSASRLSIN